jgi:hypothetical protein
VRTINLFYSFYRLNDCPLSVFLKFHFDLIGRDHMVFDLVNLFQCAMSGLATAHSIEVEKNIGIDEHQHATSQSLAVGVRRPNDSTCMDAEFMCLVL